VALAAQVSCGPLEFRSLLTIVYSPADPFEAISRDDPTDRPITIIEAGRANADYLKDLWRFRELLYILVLRDVLVRYKQTAFGLAWTILKPLLTVVVFALVFGKMVKVPSGGMPYAPFIFVALLPWLFFSTAVADASVSLLAHGGLLSKVYFPRLLVPLVAVVVALIDTSIALMLVVPMLWIFGVDLSWRLLAMVPLTAMVAILALGVGLYAATLNVRYRDTGLILPYLLQFGLYLSPIVFPSDLVPAAWRWLYSLNPMVGMIEAFRWAAFPGQQVHMPALWISLAATCLSLLLGYRYFRRFERGLADVI
jgi:lipopolysaccharide transport system permease protein